MTASLSMERLFDRVQLVNGKGSRQEKRLCVMTFVALLAGERHTDAPATASPFVRHFAIRLNDSMSDKRRQQLKLFAPRIVGTHDDCDNLRIELTRTVFAEEVLPRLASDHGHRWLPPQISCRITSFAERPFDCAHVIPTALIERFRSTSTSREINCIAREASNLLISCAQSAPEHVDSEWYWAKSLELLDRLCDVGDVPVAAPISEESVARAERLLDRSPMMDAVLLAVKDRWQAWTGHLVKRPPEHAPAAPDALGDFRVSTRPAGQSGEWDEVWTISPAPKPSPYAARIQALASTSHGTPPN